MTEVEFESGEVMPADEVVVAGGYESVKLLRSSGLSLQLPPTSARPVFTLFIPLSEGTFKGPVRVEYSPNRRPGLDPV